ncbi:hypothetical protein [Clostridium sp. BJN0001]|uniref:hypothetical protein n=1 Tax=Clostridium sp. BJN0001 TaxID=2930219 RepID=UPI001FD2B4FE|nr:hypothetical protein [Clostridium sp. BJN0001]
MKKVCLIGIFVFTIILNSLILFSNDSIYSEANNKIDEEESTEAMATNQNESTTQIDLNSIINNMCPEDKTEVKSVISKLSSDELFKIEDNNSKLDSQSFLDNVNIIKKRLGSKDYQKIEKVLKKYINFDNINI